MRDAERALARARRVIADAVLGQEGLPSASLGSITLHHHQHRAVTQLLHLIAKHHGAMLADRVGSGKTYAALAVARHFATTIVITPASLRPMWMEAAERAQVSISVASYDSLSRGKLPGAQAELVIFDEAHRLRNAGTRRYAMAATMCQHAKVLLLSATPVQNRLSDLTMELALFLGRAALALNDDALAEYVVRGDDTHASALPRTDGPYELTPPVDERVVDDLISLPSPVPAADEGVSAALLTMGLLHQWTSSQAALVAALKRRRSRGLGLIAALGAGRYPSRSELTSWTASDHALQLAFPELASVNLSVDENVEHLSQQVHRHVEGVGRVLERLRESRNGDLERASLLREIRVRHRGERILAFAQYASTVDGLFRLLVHDGHVAALTGSGARIATGRVARAEVLSQFMPGLRVASAKNMTVELLLTTDVLSEGLNLQEASVVVHLDLPWNPARMEQRVGRVRRLGSRHERIVVYVMQPSHAAERLLAIEKRLRAKLRTAERMVGVAGPVLPTTIRNEERTLPGAAESIARLRAILRDWRSSVDGRTPVPAIAAVRASYPGFLAVVQLERGNRLLAATGGALRTDVEALICAAQAATGPAVDSAAGLVSGAKQLVDEWIAHEQACAALDLRPAIMARNRRRALARISRILASAPRHRRPALAPLVAAARQVASATLSEGLERALDHLLLSGLPDEAWLNAVAGLGAVRPRQSCGMSEVVGPELSALIVFDHSATDACRCPDDESVAAGPPPPVADAISRGADEVTRPPDSITPQVIHAHRMADRMSPIPEISFPTSDGVSLSADTVPRNTASDSPRAGTVSRPVASLPPRTGIVLRAVDSRSLAADTVSRIAGTSSEILAIGLSTSGMKWAPGSL